MLWEGIQAVKVLCSALLAHIAPLLMPTSCLYACPCRPAHVALLPHPILILTRSCSPFATPCFSPSSLPRSLLKRTATMAMAHPNYTVMFATLHAISTPTVCTTASTSSSSPAGAPLPSRRPPEQPQRRAIAAAATGAHGQAIAGPSHLG